MAQVIPKRRCVRPWEIVVEDIRPALAGAYIDLKITGAVYEEKFQTHHFFVEGADRHNHRAVFKIAKAHKNIGAVASNDVVVKGRTVRLSGFKVSQFKGKQDFGVETTYLLEAVEETTIEASQQDYILTVPPKLELTTAAFALEQAPGTKLNIRTTISRLFPSTSSEMRTAQLKCSSRASPSYLKFWGASGGQVAAFIEEAMSKGRDASSSFVLTHIAAREYKGHMELATTSRTFVYPAPADSANKAGMLTFTDMKLSWRCKACGSYDTAVTGKSQNECLECEPGSEVEEVPTAIGHYKNDESDEVLALIHVSPQHLSSLFGFVDEPTDEVLKKSPPYTGEISVQPLSSYDGYMLLDFRAATSSLPSGNPEAPAEKRASEREKDAKKSAAEGPTTPEKTSNKRDARTSSGRQARKA